MNLRLIIKIKGWVTVLAGAVFALAPQTYANIILGVNFAEPGIVMAQLFGLLAIAAGWTIVASPLEVTSGSKAIGFAITDLLAVALLLVAINKGVFGLLTLSLVAVYLISAVVFIYSRMTRGSETL